MPVPEGGDVQYSTSLPYGQKVLTNDRHVLSYRVRLAVLYLPCDGLWRLSAQDTVKDLDQTSRAILQNGRLAVPSGMPKPACHCSVGQFVTARVRAKDESRIMTRKRLPAVFMRGGTSKALVFHERDLPREQAARDALFLAAMGSPDPDRRQLDGMGGGVSSLSKICIVGPPSRNDADVDYTFGQVQIDRTVVDYSGNCGNMASAIPLTSIGLSLM